jgi:hypothetical protein
MLYTLPYGHNFNYRIALACVGLYTIHHIRISLLSYSECCSIALQSCEVTEQNCEFHYVNLIVTKKEAIEESKKLRD